MAANQVMFESDCPDLTLVSRGKVRDIYDLGDSLLIVATDRISAFDVVMKTPVPDKGKVLTQMSEFWLGYLDGVVDNHLITTDVHFFPQNCQKYREQLVGRSMLVRKAEPLPIECIVRGYLVGSGWKDYQKTGCVCGIGLPSGLQQAQRLPEPIFTPSTKAEQGLHDENISFKVMEELVGPTIAAMLKEISLELYSKAAEHARQRGIIIADTKFELGIDEEKNLILIDEALTPDSSRFWPADRYQIGCSPESFDKQYLRDYLLASGWKSSDQAPELPQEVVDNTRARYLEALEILTGYPLG